MGWLLMLVAVPRVLPSESAGKKSAFAFSLGDDATTVSVLAASRFFVSVAVSRFRFLTCHILLKDESALSVSLSTFWLWILLVASVGHSCIPRAVALPLVPLVSIERPVLLDVLGVASQGTSPSCKSPTALVSSFSSTPLLRLGLCGGGDTLQEGDDNDDDDDSKIFNRSPNFFGAVLWFPEAGDLNFGLRFAPSGVFGQIRAMISSASTPFGF
mmetsp:Transcript_22383/g.47239  ORF Transcript_22383/g.47239 Transcript_22383/m.47239 type:complete len:214 (-) Transcript_22383:2084-2725(-)